MMNIKPGLTDIPTGDAGIYATIDKMIELTCRDAQSPEVRTVARKIVDDCENPADKFLLAEAVFDYVLDTIEYKFDHENVVEHSNWWNKQDRKAIEANPEDTEFLITPKCLLGEDHEYCSDLWEGDCDDMSMAFGALCKTPEIDIPVRFRIIDWKGGNAGFTHVYAEFGLKPGDTAGLTEAVWIPADPVLGEFGDEKGPENGKEFRAESFEVTCGGKALSDYFYGYQDHFGQYGMGDLTEEEIKQIVTATKETMKGEESSIFNDVLYSVAIITLSGFAVTLLTQLFANKRTYTRRKK